MLLREGRGCCRERTEDATGRVQGVLLREDRAFCREGQRLLLADEMILLREDRQRCWKSTEFAAMKGQSFLLGEDTVFCRDWIAKLPERTEGRTKAATEVRIQGKRWCCP